MTLSNKRKFNRFVRNFKLFTVLGITIYAIIITLYSYNSQKGQGMATAVMAAEAKTPEMIEVKDKGGKYAILEKIAKCESGGDYDLINDTTSAYGRYQITWATWNEMAKITGFTDKQDHLAQDVNARKLYDLRGTKPWLASKSCWSKM